MMVPILFNQNGRLQFESSSAISWDDWPRLGCLDDRTKAVDQGNEFLDGEFFGAALGAMVGIAEDLVDLVFFELLFEGALDGASKELASMAEDGAKGLMEEEEIGDAGAFFEIGFDEQDRRIDFGTWPEDAGGHDTNDFAIALGLHPNAQRAVIFGAGSGDDPFGQFLLDGDDHAFGERFDGEEIGDDGGRDVVGKVGSEFESSVGDRGDAFANRVEDRILQTVFGFEGIHLQQGDIAEGFKLPARHAGQFAVDLDGDDSASQGCHFGRQASSAGTHFKDHILFGDFGGSHNKIDKIQIDQEVLTILHLGANARFLKTVAQITLGLPLGHTYSLWLADGELPMVDLTLNVFGENVGLEIDGIANAASPQGGHLQRMRNQGHGELLLVDLDEGQADTVDGDGAFASHLQEKVLGSRDV